MKLYIGDNQIFECDSVEVDFTDMTVLLQDDGLLYINPVTIKSISVKGVK